MSKKYGFTLAEVLITLGIIGVVAALTAPALVQNSGNASIGPKLSKVKASFELANQNMMADEDCTKLTTFFIENVANNIAGNNNELEEAYVARLSRYWKISRVARVNQNKFKLKKYNGETLATDRGIYLKYPGDSNYIIYPNHPAGGDFFTWKTPEGCTVTFFINAPVDAGGIYNPNKTHIFGFLLVDIDGNKKGPYRIGKDVFGFYILKDGMLIPYGWYESDEESYWKTGTKSRCTSEQVTGDGLSCTASIFANNLKVIYE